MSKRLFLGIDLGGTNIKAGIVDESAEIISRVSIKTHRQEGLDAVIERMCQAGREAIEQSNFTINDIEAIGIGAPGTLNHKTGIIIAPPNFPDWKNVPVRDMISQRLNNLPATLENDANVAAWAEYWAGAGKGCESLVMLTLGTGIGGGVIINGRIHRGFHDTAAEIGHMMIKVDDRLCVCGQTGCIEAYASAMNMAKIATEQLQAGRESSMSQVIDAGQEITAKVIEEHLRKGDKFAAEIWEQTCRYIAIGCVNIANVIDPEMIVFTGGMAKAGDLLLDSVRKHFLEIRSYVFSGIVPKLAISEFGSEAGFIGAAGAAKLSRDLGEI